MDDRPRAERRRDSAALAKSLMGGPRPPAWWRRAPTLLLNIATIGAGVAFGQFLSELLCRWSSR